MKKAIISVIILAVILNCAPRDKYLISIAKDGEINPDAALNQRVSLEINAPAEYIWEILINVENWMNWNKYIRAVKSNGITFLGDNFAWNIDNKTFSSVVVFEPQKKLVLFSRGNSFRSIMKWEIIKLSENRCQVVLHESRDGFFMNFKSSVNLVRELSNWVNSLKFEAEANIK
jgi:hypothetical protein